MIRFINSLHPRSHIGPLQISNMGWLDVPNRVKHIKLTHLFKTLNGIGPSYLRGNITRTNSVHNHMTRSRANSLVVPRVNGPGSKSFLVTTIKDWNSLPEDLCNSISTTSFKVKTKKLLMEDMLRGLHSDFLFY